MTLTLLTLFKIHSQKKYGRHFEDAYLQFHRDSFEIGG